MITQFVKVLVILVLGKEVIVKIHHVINLTQERAAHMLLLIILAIINLKMKFNIVFGMVIIVLKCNK